MELSRFARMFKLIRMETGLTQRQLAEKLEIGSGSLYKYENNLMNPSFKVIEKVKRFCLDNKVDVPLEQVGVPTEIKRREPMTPGVQYKDASHPPDEIARLKQIIELQDYKIKALEEKLDASIASQTMKVVTSQEHQITPPPEFHCKVEYKLNCSENGVARQVKHFDGFGMVKKWLGYNKTQWLDILEIDVMVPGILESKLKCIFNEQMIEEAVKAEEAMKSLYKNIQNQTTNLSSSDRIVMLVNKEGNLQPCRIYDNIQWNTLTRTQFWHFVNGEDTV